jgi:hypothetical protein
MTFYMRNPKCVIKECTILLMVLNLLTLKAING